ncbi:MAG: PTS sugar transporter subunit IIA [Pirellulales bacterium]
MPDFDLDRLAAYLHLSPAQVARLADRGNLPGRKVAGEWRFSPSEIHHWLEDRIGASGEAELVQMEEVLRRAAGPDDDVMSIADMLPIEAIAIPLAARTRNSVISSMVDLAASTGLLWDTPKMVEAVQTREEMQPTALDNGVALLHPRRPMPSLLAQPLLALGRTSQGIPFGGSRSQLTDVFFLICSIDDRGHLRTLARLSRLIGDAGVLDVIRTAPDSATARQAIVNAEQALAE